MRNGFGAATTSNPSAVDALARTPWNSDLILSAAVAGTTNRTESFLTLPGSGLTAVIAAGTTPLVANVNGTIVRVTSNTNVTCVNGLNFIYLKNDGTFSVTTTSPIISRVQPSGPAANDHWYDLTGQGTMYKYSGAAWVATPEICVAYCYATGGNFLAEFGCIPANKSMAEMAQRTGSTGVSGTVTQSTGTLTIDTATHYSSLILVGGATLTHTVGVVATKPMTRCQFFMVIHDTSTHSAAGKGRAGASGGTGAGTAGTAASYGGTGGGGGGGTNAGAAGGNHWRGDQTSLLGAGTAGGAGSAGGNGEASVISSLARYGGSFPLSGGYGSGGGSGGGSGAANGGNSGASGGLAAVTATVVVLSTTATVTANGSNGADGAAVNCGGGGGGGGGVVYYFYAALFDGNGSTFTAAGGTGGAAGGAGGAAGGNGGAGAAIKEQW